MPDIDLDLSYTNVAWTVMFLAGFIACVLHTWRTVRRWQASRVRGDEPAGVEEAAFWFMRMDFGNDVLGLAMFLAGFCTIVRWTGPHVVWLIEIGALAYAVNKVWNLFEDGKLERFAEELRKSRSREQVE